MTNAETGALADRRDTVLVVDGDVFVRMEIARYLRDCDYRVLEAARADEAMTVLARAELNVDAILADADLPGDMNGFALARWVREHRPGVNVLLAGTAPRAAQLAAELCEEGPALTRPYDPQHVLARIRRLNGCALPG
jgi:DNA-binding response OmpR family regulator